MNNPVTTLSPQARIPDRGPVRGPVFNLPGPRWFDSHVFGQCRYGLRMLERRFRGYQPKVRVQVESAQYLVKTVENWDEWHAALRLRHEVFHQQAMGRTLFLGLDIDEIDFFCDNLVIIEKKSSRIVATYRLTSNAFTNRFYSQNRFELGDLARESGWKLELGRACVKQDARNGSTLHLLWRGISAYLQALGADTLFGSASIRSRDPRDAAAVCTYLIEEGHFASIATAHPHRTVRFESLQNLLSEIPVSEAYERARAILPPLFHSYLRAGAKVVCPPALDNYLGSTDFLTVLRVKEMQARFEKRYRAPFEKAPGAA
jgi:putative hemolysin